MDPCGAEPYDDISGPDLLRDGSSLSIREESLMRGSIGAFLNVFVMGCLGIIVAFIIEVMNTNGILIDEFITGSILITDVQTFIIAIFVLFGLVMAAVRR